MQVKIERKVGVLDLGSNTFNIKFVTFKNREVRSIFKYKKYINIIASTNPDGNIQKNKETRLSLKLQRSYYFFLSQLFEKYQ